jgi:hypothetical protein
MGLDRFELSTPSLSEKCSNQLSYRPSGLGIHAFAAFSNKGTDLTLFLCRVLFENQDVCDRDPVNRFLWISP